MHDERRVLEKSHLLAQESNRLDLKHFSAQLFPSSSSSFQTFSSSANHADSLVSEEELTRLHEQLGVFTEQPLTSDVLALAGGLPGDEDEAEHNPLADVPESELRKRKRLFDLEVYDDRAFYSLLLKVGPNSLFDAMIHTCLISSLPFLLLRPLSLRTKVAVEQTVWV